MNMMMNLFSMFDPSSSYLSSNWSLMLILLMIFFNSKLMVNKENLLMISIYQYLLKEIKQLMKKNIKASSSLMMNLFFIILSLNMLALLPFNFTLTAHISMSFSIAMTFWTSFTLFSLYKNYYNLLVHLTPMGTPSQLMNFMVLIETISIIIRPITLATRLTANMVAGHLLMNLLSNFSMMSYNYSLLSFLPLLLLLILEMMVAMIQAYVITTLLTLYYNDSM